MSPSYPRRVRGTVVVLDGQIVADAGVEIRGADRRGKSLGNNNRKEQLEEHLNLKQEELEMCRLDSKNIFILFLAPVQGGKTRRNRRVLPRNPCLIESTSLGRLSNLNLQKKD